MPFKTRRQKEAASARRFNFTQSGHVTYGTDDTPRAAKTEVKTKEAKPQTTQIAVENLSYVGSDLVKIIILAALIIFAQLVLSFIRA